MTIQLLSEGAYRSYLEPLPDAGIEASHRARVWFGDGPLHEAYVKLYPETNHGLVNEITGHLLAASLGLRVPERAAVIFVPKRSVPDLPAWAQALPGHSIPGWCTLDMMAPSLHFPLSTETHGRLGLRPFLLEELRQADEVARIIAFDDWIANVDRHLGNLLRVGKRRYLLIDHGQIFGGTGWSAATLLGTNIPYRNDLSDALAPESQTPGYRARLAQEARDNHGPALTRARASLLDWWMKLLDEPQRAAAAKFLDDRTHESQICERYQMLPL